MHVEIFRARTDIEPFPVVHHQAANLAALAYPIPENRNKGNLFLRRNSLKNCWIPNSDVGEIKISRDPVTIRDVHDPVIAQSDIGSQTGGPQCERYVVAAAEMFVNQRWQIDIGQDVAAVSDEWIATEAAFCILNATAGLQ